MPIDEPDLYEHPDHGHQPLVYVPPPFPLSTEEITDILEVGREQRNRQREQEHQVVLDQLREYAEQEHYREYDHVTAAELAEILGFSGHTAVSKRARKLGIQGTMIRVGRYNYRAYTQAEARAIIRSRVDE